MTAHTIHPTPGAAVIPSRTKAQPSARQVPTAASPPQHTAHASPTETIVIIDDRWRAHSNRHFTVRKQMIARLQRLHPLLATNTTMRYAGQFTRIPELVQRLELMLYKAAASLDEYTNICTLERRVHALVTLLEPLPPPTLMISTPKRRADSLTTESSGAKRRRRSLSTTTPSSSNCLATILSADLLSQVFSFVDGVDILRHCALVDRFFATIAPRLVTSLFLDVGDESHARPLHGHVAHVLSACTNLTALIITNTRSLKKTNNTNWARALDHSGLNNETTVASPPPSFVAAADPELFTGRVFLHELGDLWRQTPSVVFPKLAHLEFRTPFDCANEADAALFALEAFAGNAALGNVQALHTLVLDTTALGDRRVARLVGLFDAYPQVFGHQLRVLELLNNFVGEAGIAALAQTLGTPDAWPRLETLSLRRNVLTDGDANRIGLCIRALPCLARLDVRDNFIGKPGFEALAAHVPTTHVAIATAHNCMESREAAHLFR